MPNHDLIRLKNFVQVFKDHNYQKSWHRLNFFFNNLDHT